ncbi:hypothetical protein CesoFtcFv8_011992 [Champsocephalus esox]|nr:hypothetical protein CesoFtcFv8_011992 [Champsocephalus esox]
MNERWILESPTSSLSNPVPSSSRTAASSSSFERDTFLFCMESLPECCTTTHADEEAPRRARICRRVSGKHSFLLHACVSL